MAVLRFATHLWFDRDAVPAAELYSSLLPDSRIARVIPAGPGIPGPVAEGEPFIVELTLMGQQYTFFNGGPLFPFDSQVSLTVLCETQQDVDRYWSTLTDGGAEVACGWLTDPFGLSWQIVPKALEDLMSDPDRGVRERVTAAMLSMKKLDVAALEAAARG